jgi:hypothetical protein
MSLIKILENFPDERRAQGQRYQLKYIILCSVLSILCGARSYRDIERFIKVHLEKLKKLFGLRWTRAPAHTTLRGILNGVKKQTLEWYFREHSRSLSTGCEMDKGVIAVDGKILRGSFDHMSDKGALNLISMYCSQGDIILGHIETEDKSNEISAVEKLLNGFGLKGYVYTLDAMHCQKKH